MIKPIVLAGIFYFSVFILVPQAKAFIPDVSGNITVAETNAPVPNVWVKWVSNDGTGETRYALTGPLGKCPDPTNPSSAGYDVPCPTGQYFFRGAEQMPSGYTNGACDPNINDINTVCGQYNTWIDSVNTGLTGIPHVRMISVAFDPNGSDSWKDKFGCGDDPHILSVVPSDQWSPLGTFGGSLSIGMFNNQGSVIANNNFTFTPYCNISWSGIPPSPGANTSFTARVDHGTTTLGDWANVQVYKDNASVGGGTPYSGYTTWSIDSGAPGPHTLLYKVHNINQDINTGYTCLPAASFNTTITLSGKVTNVSNSPLPSVTINSGVTNPLPGPGQECYIGTATTDTNGDYSFPGILVDQGFCLRPPAVAGYISPPNPAAYDCQTAGQSNGTVSCGGGGGTTLDQPTDDAYNFVYTPVATAAPGAPKITSLQIGNGGNPSGGTAAKTSGLTAGDPGLISGQTGNDWFNPMIITLNANPGTNPITQYYTAFYDQAGGLTTQSGFLTDIQTRVRKDHNPKSAFLLAYGQGIKAGDTGNNYYVWDYALNNGNGNWANLTGTRYQVCETNPDNSKNCTLDHVYYAIDRDPLGFPGKWTVYMYKDFGSKNMFTATSVTDGALSTFKADCVTSNSLGDCKLLTP